MSKSVDEVMIPPDKRVRRDNEENQDRLTDLPDCVILHILSFLKSKFVVQTSILSTRWKHLWKRIPTLMLHSSDFSTKKLFSVFVSQILANRDRSTALHSLDLERHGKIETYLLKMILKYICSHNTHIQQLGIHVTADGCPILSCVSKCRTLTSLKLIVDHRRSGNQTETLFPKSLNLPLLTNLDLSHFSFCGGENGCAEPFSAFPKLNSLVISGCKVKDAQILSISSETLVNFAMHYCSSRIAKIELSVPSLCTFTFSGMLVQKICGSSLFSVKKININPFVSLAPEDYALALEDYSLVLLSWLQDLANVESLAVTSTTLQILSFVPDLLEVKFTSLCNLKSLEVQLVPLPSHLKKLLKLNKAFNAGLQPPPIPDGIVDFLRQNSPSTTVNINTTYMRNFNIKQVEESIKGAKMTSYHSQFSASAPSSVAPASAESAPAPATAPSSSAPPNLHPCFSEKVEESVKGVKNTSCHSQFATPATSSSAPVSTAPASAAPLNLHLCCAVTVEESIQGVKNTRYRLQFDAPASSSAAPLNLHLCCTEKMTTNVDNCDSTLWPELVTKAFIEIMVDEVTKENMQNGVFHTGTWTSMTAKLNSTTNCSYSEEQLKAKMHSLRSMFHEFYSLLQNTEFGWNAETNIVTASEEVWQNYLKTHDKASQFQNKGCDHYKLLEIIFNKNNETEVLHHSFTQDQPNTDKENELNNQYFNTRSANIVCVDDDSSNNDIQEVGRITCNEKQKIEVKEHIFRKESTTHQIGEALVERGKIVEASSSHVTKDCSLTKCVVALEEIEDISDDIYGKALEKFKDPDWREMFIAMSKDRKCGWLYRL
ncbi:Myb/SANT-like DNA-binding domain protein [Medicago truncatula]|uniref:Myb/SANT-like DNA-binding domain protein n=1 Tax=Medicago truncatula TaxID=3880 RepID=G7JSX6_MEDTR|nr:Myb/SANT-like DNA-binding domain protein [Medicago truncatula]